MLQKALISTVAIEYMLNYNIYYRKYSDHRIAENQEKILL